MSFSTAWKTAKKKNFMEWLHNIPIRLSPSLLILFDHLVYFNFFPIMTNNILLPYAIYMFFSPLGNTWADCSEGFKLNFTAVLPMAQNSHTGQSQTSCRVRLQHGKNWPYFPLCLHLPLNSLNIKVTSTTIYPGLHAWELEVTLDFSLPNPIQPVTTSVQFTSSVSSSLCSLLHPGYSGLSLPKWPT